MGNCPPFPAEKIDINSLISKDDYELTKDFNSFSKWYLSVNNKYETWCIQKNESRDSEGKYHGLNNKLIKRFKEEARPVYHYVKHIKRNFPEIKIKLESGNQVYDAILDLDQENSIKVEVTCAAKEKAIGFHKSLIRKYGESPADYNIDTDNTDYVNNYTRYQGFDFISPDDEKKLRYDLIREAIFKKCRKKYSQNTILLVAFDDNCFKDISDFKITKIKLPKINQFRKIILYGQIHKRIYTLSK
ncbi:hypothetical protein SMSP2_01433 [Limihaloglobus sulfuriphilus]|uniref:Uncharacterized protein n=2 Tax=Limihaloglobus sulfuriphilus TaxID=1851148 RepID=A0A1Q2MEJ2_9BACT|nr:hypothetical protein SMSP2_01433 [Limihaloglobus sulfuriphilus]